MRASWIAFAKVGYIRGQQYLESDQPPYTLGKALRGAPKAGFHGSIAGKPGGNYD